MKKKKRSKYSLKCSFSALKRPFKRTKLKFNRDKKKVIARISLLMRIEECNQTDCMGNELN